MPRNLSVRAVRQELYRAAGGPQSAGTGAASTMLLGQWFHEIFAGLTHPTLGASAVLDGAEPTQQEYEARLLNHVYLKWIGPHTAQHQAHLHETTEQFLSFWTATREMCRWFTALLLEAKGKKASLRIVAEQELSWELREPGWTDSVLVTGIADAVFRSGDGRWCVGEFKLGRTAPEADLAQACLYHGMLAALSGQTSPADNPLALICFSPRCSERLFSASELAPAAAALKSLIGRMAGVLPLENTTAGTERTAGTTVTARTGWLNSSLPFSTDELGRKILKVFEEFNAPVKPAGNPIVGPAFIRFPIEPRTGVKTKSVAGLNLEVQQRLGLVAAPFIHLQQGRLVVDVQRPDRQTVLFSAVRNQLPIPNPLTGNSQVPVGVDLEGKLICADLAESTNAHILVAGTTGSGKSEWLRAALAGLLVTNTPETLRLVLIDPKRNAFADLKHSPFLLDAQALVYPGDQETGDVLDLLIDEMEIRYALLEKERADTLSDWARRTGRRMPRIVCVCDEYADLISRGRAERNVIEARLCRLGSKARAAGIHLILATQHPSREIIKGALDGNMPCRVGLKMSKNIESRMILGTAGAENLLGNGDLFFRDIGDPKRLQAPLLEAGERAAIFQNGGNK